MPVKSAFTIFLVALFAVSAFAAPPRDIEVANDFRFPKNDGLWVGA